MIYIMIDLFTETGFFTEKVTIQERKWYCLSSLRVTQIQYQESFYSYHTHTHILILTLGAGLDTCEQCKVDLESRLQTVYLS